MLSDAKGQEETLGGGANDGLLDHPIGADQNALRDHNIHEFRCSKIDLYEEPDVKDANGDPVVNRVLTIMLASEY